MRIRTITASLALPLLLPLTACSSGDEAAPAPTVTVTVTEPAPASGSRGQAADTPLVLGEGWMWEDSGSTGTTTVLAYRQPVPGIEPPGESLGLQEGAVWGQVEAKVCNDEGDSIVVSQFPWSLAFSDGSRMEVTGLNGGDFPKPEFPTDDTTVKAGTCIRGKMVIPVPKGQRPERIVYAPESLEEPVEWTVPDE